MWTPEDEDCIDDEFHQKHTVLSEHAKPTAQRLDNSVRNVTAARWILWQMKTY